ncbi:hypothetical protein DL770_001229 [Monosporascus sp. CRB-9-2]|nr:hypothetical protein DL770_001229 [Monosporascus sp. CRB-9-2]
MTRCPVRAPYALATRDFARNRAFLASTITFRCWRRGEEWAGEIGQSGYFRVPAGFCAAGMIGRDFPGSYCGVPVDLDAGLGHRLKRYAPIARSGSTGSTLSNAAILAFHFAARIAHSGTKVLWLGFDPGCQPCLHIVFNWCATDTDTEFAECIYSGDGFDGTLEYKAIATRRT